MRGYFTVHAVLTVSALITATAFAGGEDVFKTKCAPCHPDGGNIINKQKTLHKKDLEANNLKTAADLVKIMRNPGPGMPKYDTKRLPDKDANDVAEYILKAFK